MTYLVKPATWLSGYIPDLPSPLDDDDRMDLAAFARLCERQIEAGVSAMVVGETAGEAVTLTPDEHDNIVRAAVGIARGRLRIIAGAGSNSTSQAIELARRAEAAGADAVLSVVPYYNKPMQAGIQAHFRAIAISTALPFILNGGDGCISVVSNVAPELCQAVFSNCRLARPQTARYLHDRLLPLTA